MNGLVLIGISMLTFVLSMGIPGFAATDNLTKEQAPQIAMKVKNGPLSKAVLEKLDGQLVWNVRIDNTSVYIDPRTGNVVKTVENVDDK